MTKLRRFTLDYIWSVFVFIILCSISVFAAMTIYKDMSIAYKQILFIIPVFINTEIRRRSSNIFVFFGSTIIVFVASAYLGAMLGSDLAYYFIFTWVYMAIITGVSVFRRFSAEQEDITVPFVVLAISVNTGLSIASGMFDLPELELFYVAFSLLQILFFIVYIRIKRLDTALELIESTSVQPIGSIMGFNNMLTLLFTLLVTVVGVLSVMLNSKNIVIYLGRTVLSFIRFLAGLSKTEQLPPEDVPISESPQGGGFDYPIFGEVKEPSRLMVFLEQVFIYVSCIVIIAGIILGIGYLFYWLHKRFSATLPENGDEKEFLIREAQEEMAEKTSGFISDLKDFLSGYLPGGDNNKKVRRIFYKKVSAHISHGVSITANNTPSEIEKKIMEKEDISSLTQVYGKARYSNEHVTDSDIASCKK